MICATDEVRPSLADEAHSNRRRLLGDAFSGIASEALEKISDQEHAIVYYEAWKVSKRVELVPAAVKHIEPGDLRTMWRKFYRWGYTSKVRIGGVGVFLRKKERPRTGLFRSGLFVPSVASLILLAIKALLYGFGLLVARMRKG